METILQSHSLREAQAQALLCTSAACQAGPVTCLAFSPLGSVGTFTSSCA